LKIHERKSFNEHKLFLYLRQSRQVRSIMFSTFPFVHPSVRSFVHPLPNCERDILKNEPISMQIGATGLRGKCLQRSSSGVRKSKVNVTGGRS